MRFMIMVRANAQSESGTMPDETLVAAMAAYHEALAKAGVLLDANGLQPSSKGWRVRYSGGKGTIVDGPFAETKELIAGYTLIQVRSREEAIEWARRFPGAVRRTGGRRNRSAAALRVRRFSASESVDRFREIDAEPALSKADVQSRPIARSTRSGASSRRSSSSPVARLVRDVGLAEELAQDALSRRSSTGRATACPTIRGAWLMATAKHRALDQLRQAMRCTRTSTRSSAATSMRSRPMSSRLRRRARRRARRRHRRRPAAADVHRLPSGAVDRSARRADAAAARRPHHRRDRARVPGARADDRAAHRARQAHAARRRACRSRCRAAPSSRDAPRVGARGDLPDLQRGLLGDGRRRLDAARALRRRAAARAACSPSSRREEPRGAWARRADGDSRRRALRRARRRDGRAGAAARSGPRALGSAADPARPGGARARRSARRRARPLRAAGRDRRLPCARAPTPTRPTGRASPRCTTRSRRSTPSPVVELNRAVAVGMAFGPQAGLAIVDALAAEPALASYHLLPSVRGDLLAKLGRLDEARAEFERAAAMTRNARERELLLLRADAMRSA